MATEVGISSKLKPWRAGPAKQQRRPLPWCQRLPRRPRWAGWPELQRGAAQTPAAPQRAMRPRTPACLAGPKHEAGPTEACLLYTSDAADDM
eukprot:8072360-Alexandrium_andersonii.AAC.1